MMVFCIEVMPIWFQVRPKSARLTCTSASSRTSAESATDTVAGRSGRCGQEAYARWYALPGPQRDAIQSPGAWLTTVTSRICLDLLGSARARRERYVGAWLPEPLPDPAEWPGAMAADPADRVTLDESVHMAFLVVLEAMTPAGRVAFILHDVFGYSFVEVAAITGRTPAACRQLASTARRKVRAARPAAAPAAQQAALVRDFRTARQAGDIPAWSPSSTAPSSASSPSTSPTAGSPASGPSSTPTSSAPGPPANPRHSQTGQV
jgi:DNA-directed RNA polymerase specialized sigma24 family protein